MPPITSPFAKIMGSMPPLIPKPDALGPAPGPVSTEGLAGATGGGGLPSFPSSAAPKVVRGPFDPSTASPEELALQPLTSRLRSDETKDLHPWGTPENHPGFMGKLGHALSVITGGPNRRQYEEMGLQKSLQDLLSSQSKNQLDTATAQHTQAETPEVAPNAESERGLQGAQTANLQSETSERNQNAAQGPDLAVAYSHAVNQAIAKGQDPAQDPIVQHLADAITNIQKQTAPKGMEHVNLQGPGGKPVGGNYDPNTGKYFDAAGKEIANPVLYEKPNVTNINAGEKTWEYANNQLNTLGKPVADLNMRMGRLRDTLAAGTPQADALVAPELLTVMAGGQGSGLRMNEAEISRIVGGRSHWENLRGAMQKWSTDPEAANSITPDQRQQIHALVNAVNAKLQAKQSIINEAANQMVDVDDPKQQRRILSDVRQKLQAVDEGNAQGNQGETKEYQGHTYQKGADGQWHLQQK